nr:hypothetical protein [uncultured Allomuricauda sp.]
MKKKYVLYSSLIFFVIGCQESEPISIDETQISSEAESLFEVKVQNGMLHFPSRNDYDSALEFLGPMSSEELQEWTEALGFESMKSSISLEEREKEGIYDELLASLINTNAEISIGMNTLRLDALGEMVYVTSNSEYGKASSNKGERVFSTEDNVLDILDGIEEESTTSRSRYCKKRKLSWDINFRSNPNKIHAKVVYQKAGFLNSLQSKIEEELGLNGTSAWKMFLRTNGSGNFWRNKKRTGTIGPYQASIFNRANKSYRPYYSSRRLRAYKFSIEFWAQSDNDGVLRKRVITIDCN